MMRIVHISDLHFGRIDPSAIECLELFLSRQGKKIDLIIATGDWTQRARTHEFKAAADFIERLPAPVVSVPGNHDIPLYNVFRRFAGPLNRYERYIASRTTDIFENESIVVAGLVTPHKTRSIEGKISGKELSRISEIFSAVGNKKLKVLACHHPVFAGSSMAKLKPEYRVDSLLALNPDIILSGHFHLNSFEQIPTTNGHPVLHLSAGSATSNRLRGEANSFNLIEIENLSFEIANFSLETDGFIEIKRENFQLILRN